MDEAPADESSSGDEEEERLGDKLFQSDEEENKIKELHALNDPKLQRAILEQDSPELQGLLQEFRDNLETATQKLQPLLAKMKAKQIPCTQAGMSFLEMKYNLMMSYCTFLSFYLLLKLEGKDVS